MNYTDVFIDFDDTLYDTHGNAVIALQELFGQFQLSRYFTNPDRFYDAYWKANYDLWHQYALGQVERDYLVVERFRRPLSAGFTPQGTAFEPSESLCREIGDAFLELCADKPGVVEGAHRLMQHLKQRGYRTHMCSNGFHEVQYRKLRASGLDNYFDTVVLSEDAGANKPSSEYFDYAFRMTHARPSTTVMIGDNISTDIIGAHQAGIHTIFFNRFNLEHPSNSIADVEVRSLDEICGIL